MQLTEVLLACNRPQEVERKNAESQLQHALQNHTDEYFRLLAEELADDSKPLVARQLAGLQLKNALYGKSKSSNRLAEDRWLRVSDAVKVRVRELLVLSLQSKEDVGRKFAALVFGKLAAIEIPNRAWPKMVSCLLERVENSKQSYTNDTRRAAIQALGFISEEIAILTDEGVYKMDDANTTAILAAIVQGMLDEDREIKLEATKAMFFTILLAEDAFQQKEHRDMLMEMILRASMEAADKENQKNALEILTKVVERYYEHLAAYMPVIAEATWSLIQTSDGTTEGADIRAMMVWTQIAEEELNILEENHWAGREVRKCLNFVYDARKVLIPHLTAKLVDFQQAEDYDSEEYTLKMASQISLKYCAQILRNDVIAPVVEFVTKFAQSENWREREAAILAVGSIMDGPTSGSELEQMLTGCFDYLYENLRNPVVAVRDTTAWTIATIVKHHLAICNADVLLQNLTNQLSEDVPRVCRHICFAIHVIAEQQYPMSPLVFQNIAQVLLKRADDESQAAKEQRLQSNAYNALAIMIKKCCDASNATIAGNPQNLALLDQTVEGLTQEVLRRLEEALRTKRADPQCEVHGNLCVCLSELVEKIPKQKILQNAMLPQKMMTLYIECFELYAGLNGGGYVPPDTLMAVGLVVKKLGENFEPYLQPCVKYLVMALSNYEDVQTCNMATALIGNPLASNLKDRLWNYTESLIPPIIKNVHEEDCDRKIKLSCICALGDCAMALGGKFVPALPQVATVLQSASQIIVEDADYENLDWIEYVNKLRETVLEAYISIAYGLSEAGQLDHFKAYVNAVLLLISVIVEDSKRPGKIVNNDVMRQACSAMGDLVNFFQSELCSYLRDASFVPDMIKFAEQSNDAQVLQMLSFLQTGLRKYGQ
eukprot:g11696.t1